MRTYEIITVEGYTDIVRARSATHAVTVAGLTDDQVVLVRRLCDNTNYVW